MQTLPRLRPLRQWQLILRRIPFPPQLECYRIQCSCLNRLSIQARVDLTSSNTAAQVQAPDPDRMEHDPINPALNEHSTNLSLSQTVHPYRPHQRLHCPERRRRPKLPPLLRSQSSSRCAIPLSRLHMSTTSNESSSTRLSNYNPTQRRTVTQIYPRPRHYY